MRPVWAPAPRPETAEALEAAGVPPRLATLLARRGVGSRAEAEAFLSPSLDQLHDPHLLAGLTEAVERISRAADSGERVAVVGDYDVDGVTSTALLTAVFRACGIDVLPILPDRLREGYGFLPVHVERAANEGVGLIVTADCGTGSNEAATQAGERGLDLIVTDHHLPGDLPCSVLQINPRQPHCTYPFTELAGVGLALKLALAVAEQRGRSLPIDALLRVACLGTIADLVPLQGENRVIASLGLRALAETRSAGLRALIREAHLQAPFSAEDVGFRLGPRINAAGRLHDPQVALRLLLTRDPEEGSQMAELLGRWNGERQALERTVVDEARSIFEERSELPGILVAWSPGWHRGVVGIAAGRLARELQRPTILLSVDDSQATGSGRSIKEVDLHGFLSEWRGRMPRFGGHPQAVGLTLETESLEPLREEWEQAASSWPVEVFTPRLQYELELPASAVDRELLHELGRLEPFGQGNRRPLLRVGPLELEGPPKIFGKGHLKARARGADGHPVHLLGWRWQERAELLAGRFEALGFLEDDRYLDAPVLRLEDCRPDDAGPT